MKTRAGEKGTPPLRTGRFFILEHAWYFMTREGTAVGPFETKEAAEMGLMDFVDFVERANPDILNSFLNALKLPR